MSEILKERWFSDDTPDVFCCFFFHFPLFLGYIRKRVQISNFVTGYAEKKKKEKGSLKMSLCQHLLKWKDVNGSFC